MWQKHIIRISFTLRDVPTRCKRIIFFLAFIIGCHLNSISTIITYVVGLTTRQIKYGLHLKSSQMRKQKNRYRHKEHTTTLHELANIQTVHREDSETINYCYLVNSYKNNVHYRILKSTHIKRKHYIAGDEESNTINRSSFQSIDRSRHSRKIFTVRSGGRFKYSPLPSRRTPESCSRRHPCRRTGNSPESSAKRTGTRRSRRSPAGGPGSGSARRRSGLSWAEPSACPPAR